MAPPPPGSGMTSQPSPTMASSQSRISRLKNSPMPLRRMSENSRQSSEPDGGGAAENYDQSRGLVDSSPYRQKLRQERLQRMQRRKNLPIPSLPLTGDSGSDAVHDTPTISNVTIKTPRSPQQKKDPPSIDPPAWQNSPVVQRQQQPRQEPQQAMRIQPLVQQKQQLHELYEQQRKSLKKHANSPKSDASEPFRRALDKKPDPEPFPMSGASRSLSRRRAAAAAAANPRIPPKTTVAAQSPDRSTDDTEPPRIRIASNARSPVFEGPLDPESKSDEFALSPNVNQPSFVHVHSASPRSAIDGIITNDATFINGNDASTDQGDDDATLTSVRRIMGGENTSDEDESHPRQQGSFEFQLRIDETDTAMSGHTGSTKNGGDHSTSTSTRRRRTLRDVNKANTPGDNLEFSIHSAASGSARSRYHEWLGEEKVGSSSTDVFQAISSEYDIDGDARSKSSHQSLASIDGPAHSQGSGVNDYYSRLHNAHSGEIPYDDDDDDRERPRPGHKKRDDASVSASSGSYATRQRRAQNLPGAAPIGSPSMASPSANSMSFLGSGDSPLINKDDVEHYTKSLDTPAVKLSAGVVTAATVGCFVLGPVGLLVGAAAVGIGVGVMQIPEEQRNNMQNKAKKAIHEFHEKAIDASESLSNSCATTYQESGVAEHFPQCLPAKDATAPESESVRSEGIRRNGIESVPLGGAQNLSTQPRMKHDGGAASPLSDGRIRNKKVACFRNARVVPAGQIHALDPGAQPRAWLDVMASANTSVDEKNEAMEEILILAKDKRRARILLEEGILDSIMWILYRHLEKLDGKGKENNWANPDITDKDHFTAKLAATCCVTLGKAHCAAIHTEGDLLLMSLYERGTVPEERQVAQMLHEVPHHVRVTKTMDPTVVDPSNEVFALKQLTLPQAEELSRSIKSVADSF